MARHAGVDRDGHKLLKPTRSITSEWYALGQTRVVRGRLLDAIRKLGE